MYEMLFEKAGHDQVKQHLSTVLYYECENCGDKLRDDGYAVTKDDSDCPRCGHVLFWSRIPQKEAEHKINQYVTRYERRLQKDGIQRSLFDLN